MVQMLVRNLFLEDWFVFLKYNWLLYFMMAVVNWFMFNRLLMMNLNRLLDDFFRVMCRLVDFLFNHFFFFDDGLLVVNVKRFYQRVYVLLLLNFYWNVNDDLPPSTTAG